MAAEVIKRTVLANDVVVVTIRQACSHLIRPFQTFIVTPTSRYAQRLTDHRCAVTALHAHEVPARDLMKGGELRP